MAPDGSGLEPALPSWEMILGLVSQVVAVVVVPQLFLQLFPQPQLIVHHHQR